MVVAATSLLPSADTANEDHVASGEALILTVHQVAPEFVETQVLGPKWLPPINLDPSAEEAVVQLDHVNGMLLDVQVCPEFVDET